MPQESLGPAIGTAAAAGRSAVAELPSQIRTANSWCKLVLERANQIMASCDWDDD